MGSVRIPHQGSNKADALSTELQGQIFKQRGMLTRRTLMSTAPACTKYAEGVG